MLDLDPFIPLQEVTEGWSRSLHRAAMNAFPHTTSNASKPGGVIKNSWYDEECCETRRCLQGEVSRGLYTQTSKRKLRMTSKEEKEIIFS